MIEFYTYDTSNGQRVAIMLEERLLRYLSVADARLADREWLADEPSIADFALYPIYAVRKAVIDAAGGMPNLGRWAAALAGRPGVARAMRPVA